MSSVNVLFYKFWKVAGKSKYRNHPKVSSGNLNDSDVDVCDLIINFMFERYDSIFVVLSWKEGVNPKQ